MPDVNLKLTPLEDRGPKHFFLLLGGASLTRVIRLALRSPEKSPPRNDSLSSRNPKLLDLAFLFLRQVIFSSTNPHKHNTAILTP